MSQTNYAKIFVDSDGRITKTEDDSFIVSGSSNVSAIGVYLDSTDFDNASGIVGYASFKRADGMTFTNRPLTYTEIENIGNKNYFVYLFTFTNTDRILDIAGPLEVSFTLKSTTQTIAVATTTLLIRRTVKAPNVITESTDGVNTDEVYDLVTEIVEPVEQKINGHLQDFENPHEVRGDQVPLDDEDQTAISDLIKNLQILVDNIETDLDGLDNKVEKTDTDGVYAHKNSEDIIIPTSSGSDANALVKTNEEGKFFVNEPSLEGHPTPKLYVDTKVTEANTYTDGKVTETKEYVNTSVSLGVDEAKAYAKGQVTELETNTKAYADTKKTEANTYTDGKVADAVTQTNTYTDTEITKVNTSVENKFTNFDENLSAKIAEEAVLQNWSINYTEQTALGATDKLIVEDTGKNIKYTSIQNLANKIKEEVVDSQEANQVFVFDDRNALINAITVSYDSNTLYTSIVSLTTQEGVVYTAEQLKLGATFYLKDTAVPDYWLSAKTLYGQITDVNDYINFFFTIDTSSSNISLDNYYDKEDVDTLIADFATEEQITFSNNLGTTQALGGIKKGEVLSGLTGVEILNKLLFPYVAFSVSMSTTAAGGTKEVGTSYTVSTATVYITMGSAPIYSIIIKRGSTVLLTKTSGIVAGSNTITLPTAQTVDETVTFSCTVTDSEGTSKSANATAFTFVYPYYYGAINNGVTLTEALVKGLTKLINTKGTKTVTITMNQQNALFAYPKSYGTIKTILDANGFNVTDTFVRNELAMYDTTYYVYVLSQPATASMTYTFSYS